jgi:hypothetical protein
MLRIAHCLDSLLTDGGEVVSLNAQVALTPQKHFIVCFWYSFLLEAESNSGPSAAVGIK